MKWLTMPQIKHRSKTAKGALKVSYEHWNQLYTATAKELGVEYEKTNAYLNSSDYCGLCNYYTEKHGISNKCHYCPLRVQYGCGGDLWGDADEALCAWGDGDGDWHTWKRACKALRDKLKELMEQD